MGKSRAEIQKAYRQRLKEKNNEEYLQRERDRMRRNYIPTASLSDNDKKKRNAYNRQKLREFYNRKRQQRIANNTNDLDTSGYESEQVGPHQDRGRLAVRMNFQNNRRNGAIRRWKRELSEANSRIRLLEKERDEMKKRYRTAQRSVQRQKNRVEKPSTSELTPNKQTEKMMKDANLSMSQKSAIKKSLLLGNVLVSEIKSAKAETSRSKMKAIHSVVSGKVMKKYKCSTYLSKVTGLCRHRLDKSDSKMHQVERSTRVSTVKTHKGKVENFMKREDNSRVQPGKQDAKRLKRGEKVQTHVLTDYLTNLYNKFKSENPTFKISFTSFCRSRPKYILTAAFSSRSSCLCTKHQNAMLTMKALRREGFNISINPENGIGQLPNTEVMKRNLNGPVTLGQWTRIEVEEKGKKKYVTKIVESQMTVDKFISYVETQMLEFSAHVKRVYTQYDQIRTLKENLPNHEMIIQLDFAENYSCKSLEEVQSAYFNQTSVTLHPMVAYFKSDDGTLKHKSFIIISDEMAHRSSTVITFINEVMPELKEIDSNLRCIHYWSDSPTSQYRNKHIFNHVANHEAIYGIRARWNYFEAGHGKGPCDGLGGTCKRLADEAMRSGKVIIQDAAAFYDWTLKSSMTNVMFKFVPTSLCTQTETHQEKSPLKSIKGTMKVHAVVGIGESMIKVRDVSCYCSTCLTGLTCDSWRIETTKLSTASKQSGCVQKLPRRKATQQASMPNMEAVADDHEIIDKQVSGTEIDGVCEEGNTEKTQHKTGDYIAAIYEHKWYIGKINDSDDEEHEYEIDFMEARKQFFQWPRNRDLIWLDCKSIMCSIDAPTATGKSCRMFQLAEADRNKILNLFSKLSQ